MRSERVLSLSNEKTPLGKRKDVTMTFYRFKLRDEGAGKMEDRAGTSVEPLNANLICYSPSNLQTPCREVKERPARVQRKDLPGQALNASLAASSLPFPSIIT